MQGMTFNSGLDAAAVMAGSTHLLAKYRILKAQAMTRWQRPWLYPAEVSKIVARDRRALVRVGFVREVRLENGEIGWEFIPEGKILKTFLHSRDDQGKPVLSLRQKKHLYSVAVSYRFFLTGRNGQDANPKGKADWVAFSFAITILGFSDMTGQQKIASRLGLARETVNRKSKRSRYLKVIPQHLELGRVTDAPTLLKNLFRANSKLGAYWVSHAGVLYRKIPNAYKSKFHGQIYFDRKTFRFSHKVLRKEWLAGSPEVRKQGRFAIINHLAVLHATRGSSERTGASYSIFGASARQRNKKHWAAREKTFRAVITPRLKRGEIVTKDMYGAITDAGLEAFAMNGEIPSGAHVVGPKGNRFIRPFATGQHIYLIEKQTEQKVCKSLPDRWSGEVRILKLHGALIDIEDDEQTFSLWRTVRVGTTRQVQARSKLRENQSLAPALYPTRLHSLSEGRVDELPGRPGYSQALEQRRLSAVNQVNLKRTFFETPDRIEFALPPEQDLLIWNNWIEKEAA